MKQKKFSLRTLERTLLVILLSLSIFLGATVAYIVTSLSSLESIEKLESFRNKIPTKVYDINGKLFAEFFYQKREIIPFDQIPKNLINALVAMEDNNFYSHFGLDLWGMARAIFVDIISGKAKQGGSTITQQLAKRLFTASEKSIQRKIKELWYAIQIEKKYSKNEILELYCNEIYFGHGAYGIEAASKIYFQKPAKNMNLAECALLAALPSAPNFFSPIAFPNRCRHRQRLVLLKMVELKYITREQADKSFNDFWAEFSKKNLSPTLSAWSTKVDKAPYFTEYVRQQLIKIYGKDRVNEDGLRVYTTLDLKMQNAGNKILREMLHSLSTNYQAKYTKYNAFIQNQFVDTLDVVATIFDVPTIKLAGVKTTAYANKMADKTFKAPLLMLSFLYGIRDMSSVLDKSYNYNKKIARVTKPEGALVAIDPRNGYIKTLIGGSKFSPANRFNRAVQAMRQPGSSFKPFVYLAAISSKLATAGTSFDDAPVAYKQANGQLWLPRNYDRHYSGRLVLRDALKFSVNIISVKLLDLAGYERVTSLSAALLHINPKDIEKRFVRAHSLALGGSEVTPFELCNAFAIMANYGKDVKPISLLRVYDRDGKLIDDFLRKRDYDRTGKRIENKQLVDKAPMFILITMMEDVVKSGTAAKAKKDAKVQRRVAGKTGTASNWKDIWFAGFTPQLAATVWFGFDDPGISLGRSAAASEVAAPVVMQFFRQALYGTPHRWYGTPAGVYKATICKISGKHPTKFCDKTTTYSEWFMQGTGVKGKCEECERIAKGENKGVNVFKLGLQKNNGSSSSKSKPTIGGGKLNTDDLFKD